MRLKILLLIFILASLILSPSVLRRANIIKLPCMKDSCLLGGECVKLNDNKLCLNVRSVDDLCDQHCSGKKCRIGVDKPVTINCR